MRVKILMVAGLLPAVLCPLHLQGQQDRAQLIEASRLEFDADRQLQLLVQASNPAIGPLDSLWAAGVHELASALVGRGETEQADTWLRWLAHLGSESPVDTVRILPAVRDALEEARRTVQDRPGPDDATVNVSWQWPTQWSPNSAASLEFAPSSPAAAVLRIEGRDLAPGTRLDLRPGSYEMAAQSAGFIPSSTSAEVLPGITTLVRIDLLESLPDDVAARVASGLVAIRSMRAGTETCVTGVIADAQGWILAQRSAVSGADRIFASGGGTQALDLQEVLADESTGLAVLRTGVPGLSGAQVGVGSEPRSQRGWTVSLGGCEATRSVTATRASWDSVRRHFQLAPMPSPAGLGGALVDANGGLLGLLSADGSAIASSDALALVERARRTLVAQVDTPDTPGGGVPWKWIGLGVGAVGGLAFALSGGDSGPLEPPPPTTGRVVVNLPPAHRALPFVISLGGGR